MPVSAYVRQQQTIAPGQPIPAARQRDKFVPLPDDLDEGPDEGQALVASFEAAPTQESLAGRGDYSRASYAFPPVQGSVPGGLEGQAGDGGAGSAGMSPFLSANLFEDLPAPVGMPPPPPPLMFDTTSRRGRVTFYCVSNVG